MVGQTVSRQDILIDGERIKAIGNVTPPSKAEVIDASGKIVMPGAIDPHVHFNLESKGSRSVHDYETGTRAAVFGGVTSILDFSPQIPGQPLVHTLKVKKEEAAGSAYIDWGVHPIITQVTPASLDEIPLLVFQGAPTVKCFMAYGSEGLKVEDEDLRLVMYVLRREGGMLMIHAEDDDLIQSRTTQLIEHGLTKISHFPRSHPAEAEIRAIQRCIRLVSSTGGPLFIVHLSTSGGMELISSARAKGMEIYSETCTHLLAFGDEKLKEEDGVKWLSSPPLRPERIRNNLWKGIGDGRIAMVSSDDAAFSWEDKCRNIDRFDLIPSGIPGIECRVPFLFSEGVVKGRLSLPRFVELVSTSPARLFGLAPHKGTLLPGSDADIVILDPDVTWPMSAENLHMGPDWSAYGDIEVTGKVDKVFSRGELILDGEKMIGKKGRGRYLARKLDSKIRSTIY